MTAVDDSVRVHTRTVGFVGLGAMGSPMSRTLVAAGWDVLGHDLDADACERLRSTGGVVVDDVADLPGRADVVVTSLPSVGAVRAVITMIGTRAAEVSAPVVIVDTSTLALPDKESARDLAASYGMVLLDCPVSGTSAQAERGDLVAYLSGSDESALALAAPLVEDMTRAVHHVGAFGNGTRMKLVANLLVAVHNLAAAEALLLAQRSGLDLDQVLAAVGDGAGGSRMLEVRGPLMLTSTYEPATASVQIFQKDLQAIQALAASVESPTPLLASSVHFYDRAMAEGRAAQDTACVFDVLAGSVTPAPAAGPPPLS